MYTCVRASKLHKQSRHRERGNAGDVSCSLIKHYNDNSVSLTNTCDRFSLSPSSIKSIASRNRHRLSTRYTYSYIYKYKSMIKDEKKMRRSLILVAPTKRSCMRMMLINGDNECTSPSITHSASVRILKRKNSPFRYSLLSSLFFISIPMVHL